VLTCQNISLVFSTRLLSCFASELASRPLGQNAQATLHRQNRFLQSTQESDFKETEIQGYTSSDFRLRNNTSAPYPVIIFNFHESNKETTTASVLLQPVPEKIWTSYRRHLSMMEAYLRILRIYNNFLASSSGRL